MHHRRCNEVECVVAQGECVALLDGNDATLEGEAVEEVGKHLQGLGAADELHFGISREHVGNERCVVGFHVVRDEIVGLAACKGCCEICLPLVSLAAVGSIHNRYLLILDKIGVVAHAFRHDVLALEKVNVEVVNTDVLNVIHNS